MPITITLDGLPAGTAAESVRGGKTDGETTVGVIPREFLSSEDGDRLIKGLEDVSSMLLGKIPADRRPKPSQIDHLLAVIHKDKKATLYINELQFKVLVSTKKAMKASQVGQPVYVDDIADIHTLEFLGVEIPNDAGIFFIFSFEWRRGLFYDLTPFQPDSNGLRDHDINHLLGRLYAYLMLQDRIKISEDVWEKMFVQDWFPFISLSSLLIEEMKGHAEAGWEIDDLLPKITGEVKQALDNWLEKWAEKSLYKEHIELIRTAAERFLASDHRSAISILYPRIEGLLRDYHRRSQGSGERQSQEQLVETAIQTDLSVDRPKLPLLPEKFKRYLSEVYFRKFDPNQPEGVSRNTVSHGVAPVDAFSEKGSVIGFLILDQLLYFFAE